MRKIYSGRILTYDEENRIISIRWKNKIKYFYIQRALLNRISKYVEISRFIQFVASEETRIYRHHKVLTIDYIVKIMEIRYRKNIVYYDVKNIKKGTKDLVNNLGYKMFLDMEMSMHPYKVDKDFKQEIIQVGFILVDDECKVLEKYNQIIQPTRHKKLSRRTLKFLEITQDDVDNGIQYEDFYKHFRALVDTFNPAIVVWGRNDFLALRDSYKINSVPSLCKRTRYVNLLKLHKNYFNLRNDLGLFNALRLYYDVENNQAHNAYEDAKATIKIFTGFRDVLNNRRKIDLSNYK